MNSIKSFIPKHRKKVLISKDFREILITQNTSIIEQRIIVMILSAIKDQQSELLSIKQSLKNRETQLSFDDYYEGWANQGLVEFIIPLAQLNPQHFMKNSAIQEALVNMTNINWMRLKDEKINGYKAVPFILEPSWNHKYIYFKMDKAVMKNLLNISQYYSFLKELVNKTSVSNTLRFLLWLLKFRRINQITKEYEQILKELNIPTNKYEGSYRFERDFLKRVKADLDAFNDLSFNYSREKDVFQFVLYYTKESIGNKEFPTLESLQIDRALNYLKIKRKLNEKQIRIMKDLFEIRDYNTFSKILKRKIDNHLYGEDYIKAVFKLLEKTKG
jgi:hypothetical protein